MAAADDDNAFYWEWIGCPPPEPKKPEPKPGPKTRVLPLAAPPPDGARGAQEAAEEEKSVSSFLEPLFQEEPPSWRAPTSAAPEETVPEARSSLVPVSFGPGGQVTQVVAAAPQPPPPPPPPPKPPSPRAPPAPPVVPSSVAEASGPVRDDDAAASGRPAVAPTVPEPAAASESKAPRNAPKSLDQAISDLGMMQLMLAVPTVVAIRSGRPLRRLDDELYVAQFVLQSTERNFNSYLGSEEGRCEFHPHLRRGSAGGHVKIQGSESQEAPPPDPWEAGDDRATHGTQAPSGLVGDDGGSFGWLDDGTHVVYQTNGIARTEEPLVNMPIKCSRTGAPGHYMETKMLVARRRANVAGLPAGIQRAKTMRTRKDIEENLFYSFTSCWQIYACAAPAGELGDDDSGERILVRRSVKDFTQHFFHDFPAAKHLSDLLDQENQSLINAFSFDPQSNSAQSMFAYQCYTLRAWQTYEFDGKPPEEDLGVQLVRAARTGRVAEVKRLVQVCGCDPNTIISEFGCIGSGGRMGFTTRNECAYAEERTALVAAVEAGWLLVVEAILDMVQEGKVNVDVICHEWTPKGIGGECLRPCYTALDQSRLYHREEIRAALLRANAHSHAQCRKSKRENPFDVRARQDRGDNQKRGYERNEHEDRYADFSFVDWDDEVQVDQEMKTIVEGLKEEVKQLGRHPEAEQTKIFRKLCLRWHPDKHPDDRKDLATRIFQWLQRVKTSAWESKAWTA